MTRPSTRVMKTAIAIKLYFPGMIYVSLTLKLFRTYRIIFF
jgi:hypothetical protein